MRSCRKDTTHSARGATPIARGPAAGEGRGHRGARVKGAAGLRRSSIGTGEIARRLSRALGLGTTSPEQVYGWLQNSFTGNPSRPADGMNFGVNLNDRANRWMGNQYYLVVEDKTEQTYAVNLGWRVNSLFGNDWQ